MCTVNVNAQFTLKCLVQCTVKCVVCCRGGMDVSVSEIIGPVNRLVNNTQSQYKVQFTDKCRYYCKSHSRLRCSEHCTVHSLIPLQQRHQALGHSSQPLWCCRKVQCRVHCTVYNVVYSGVYCPGWCGVQCQVTLHVARGECSLWSKSAKPATLIYGYSFLFISV